MTTKDNIFYFAQALPHNSKGPAGDLLRWVAKSLDKLGDVEIVDVNFVQPMYKDDQPMLAIVYRYKGSVPAGVENYRIKQDSVTLEGRGLKIAELLSLAAEKAKELGLDDLSAISVQDLMTDPDTDKKSLTLYY